MHSLSKVSYSSTRLLQLYVDSTQQIGQGKLRAAHFLQPFYLRNMSEKGLLT